jgi:hypothetical protein
MLRLASGIFVAAIAGAHSTVCATAQPFAQAATRVEPGKEVRIGLINSIDPKTCNPRLGETARIAVEPSHGVAEIRREPVLLTTKDCQLAPVQGYAIYYRAPAGFSGRDRVTIELRVEEINTTDVYFFSVEVR